MLQPRRQDSQSQTSEIPAGDAAATPMLNIQLATVQIQNLIGEAAVIAIIAYAVVAIHHRCRRHRKRKLKR